MGLILAFIPHFIKNGLLYQNPISPIGSGGMGWLNQTWYGPEVTRQILLTYPLSLTYGSYWAQYGNLSPLILAFFPLSFFVSRPRSWLSSPLVVITFVALIAVAVWTVYSPSVFSPRYTLASLLLLALLPARAAEYATLNDRSPRLLTLGIMISTFVTLITVGLYFLDIVFSPMDTAKYLAGMISECDRDGADCFAMEAINRRAEPGERVFVASYQHYWLNGELLQCISNSGDYIPVNKSGDDLWLELYQKGFGYLYLDTSSHGAFFERLDVENHPQWVNLLPLYEASPLKVYKIKYINPPSNVKPMICQRRPSSTIWEVVSP